MKDIKSYVIGFLTCACMFLIMGQTKSDSQIGRYQGFSSGKTNVLNMLDTTDGTIFYRKCNEMDFTTEECLVGEWVKK